jgi:hypothetical protein
MRATIPARTARRITAERPPTALGKFFIVTGDTRFTCQLAALGTLGAANGTIAILSTVASQTAIKALHACLSKAAKTEFRADCEGYYAGRELVACDSGYRFHATKFSFGTWHSLAVARLPGLICKLTDASLWNELTRQAFTTPLLPKWMPWLRAELERQECLRPLHSFQCAGAVLNLTTEALDEIVSEGLRWRKLKI